VIGGASLRSRRRRCSPKKGYCPPRRAQSVACLEPNAEVCSPVALRAAAPSGVQSGQGWNYGPVVRPDAVPPFAATDSFERVKTVLGPAGLVAERPGCRARADLTRSFRAEGEARATVQCCRLRAGWTGRGYYD